LSIGCYKSRHKITTAVLIKVLNIYFLMLKFILQFAADGQRRQKLYREEMNVSTPCISIVTGKELNSKTYSVHIRYKSVSFTYQPAYSWMEISILIFLPQDEIQLSHKKFIVF